jgi:dTDP-4-dehydrorhamnose 3,5-epimerase
LGTVNLEKILVTPLSRIKTEGGDVLHAMKNSDLGFTKFGEAYFSEINFGQIKAWKRHKLMTLNLVVPTGKVKFVFFENSEEGGLNFRTEEIGEDSYSRITVPPSIWFGFKGMAKTKSIVLNLASEVHDPNEVERVDQVEFSYNWS